MTLRNGCPALSFAALAWVQVAVAAAPSSAPPTAERSPQFYLNAEPALRSDDEDSHFAIDTAQSPLAWSQKQEITVTDGDGLGVSMVVVGALAIIGAPATNTYQGAVYIYQRQICLNGSCTWVQKQRLVASDGLARDEFGSSVAYDGTTAFVGASNATVNGTPQLGAVYVFTHDGSNNFSQAQKLITPDGPVTNCAFGASVAVSGSNALVGSPCGGNNSVLYGHGSAYRYTRGSDGTWSVAQKLVASDGSFGEYYGNSVAITADTAVVGAPLGYQFGYYGVGSAYTYAQQCFSAGCNPMWLETQKLYGDPASTDMEFGASIAFDGTRLVIGAPYALTGTGQDGVGTGAAYVFAKTNGLWTQTQEITASDVGENWGFGARLAMSGTTLVAGSPGAGWPNQKGAAYVFSSSGGSWTQVQELTAGDGAFGDSFGLSVGIASSSDILVGAPKGDSNTTPGDVYVFGGP